MSQKNYPLKSDILYERPLGIPKKSLTKVVWDESDKIWILGDPWDPWGTPGIHGFMELEYLIEKSF